MGEISPLFAVEAEQLMLAGEIDEAVRLCLDGLEVYPGYSAAYLILIRSYKEKGKFREALDIIHKAEEIFPRNPGIIALKSETRQDIKLQSTPAFTDFDTDSDQSADLKAKYKEVRKENQPPTYSQEDSFIPNAEIAKADDNAFTPAIDNGSSDNNDDYIGEDDKNPSGIDFEDTVFEEDTEFDISSIQNKFTSSQKESPESEEIEEFANKDYPLSLLLNIDPEEQKGNLSEIKFDDPALIPGIEYSPLGLNTDNITLPELKSTPVYFPPFPDISRGDFDLGGIESLSTNKKGDGEESIPATLSGPSQTIEELARRLESLKNSNIEEIDVPMEEIEKPVITETIADIFVKQGLTDAAIDAYSALMIMNPERKQEYQEIVSGLIKGS